MNHLCAEGGVGVAAERPQVDVERTPALRAIHVDVNAAGTRRCHQLANRQPDPADVRDVGERQDAGAVGERRDEGVDQLLGRGRRRGTDMRFTVIPKRAARTSHATLLVGWF